MPQLSDTYLFNDANLISYWKLEDVNDSKGSNNLTNNGTVTFPAGKFGNSALLNGSSKYLSIADASQTGLDLAGDFAMSVWIKLNTQPGSGLAYQIITKDDVNQRQYAFTYLDVGGVKRIAIFIHASNAVYDEVYIAQTLPVGVWTHICLTCDISNSASSEFVFYINGVKIGNGTVATDGSVTAIQNTTAQFEIGRRIYSGFNQYLDGSVDDIAIFSRILTDQEVLNIYQSNIKKIAGVDLANTKKLGGVNNIPVELSTLPLASDANLQGYWKLEANGNDSGPNGYNLTANGSPSFVTGKFGNAVDLESTSSQNLSIADGSCPNLEISGSKTWMCWFKPESISTQVILGKVTGASGVQIFFTTTYIQFYHNGTATNGTVSSSAPLIAGQWYHVAGIYDSSAGKLRLYLNGVLVSEVTATGTSSDGNSPFYIGRNDEGNYFDGIIDDVAIFNRALTDAEVSTLYNSQIKKFVGVANA